MILAFTYFISCIYFKILLFIRYYSISDFMATYSLQWEWPPPRSHFLYGFVSYQLVSYILDETCSSVVNLRKYNTENLRYSVLILDNYIPNIFNNLIIRQQMVDEYSLKSVANIEGITSVGSRHKCIHCLCLF
jgi:hypothetical protein